MKWKESLTSVTGNICPNCHKAPYFKANNPYNLKHFAEMNRYCDNCHFDFKQEPGFYFGASYVSYGLQVFIFLILYFSIIVFANYSVWWFIAIAVLLQIILLPIIFRLSRLIWINLFGDFKKK
jgi:uncharacterized protein (DUF983 family)